jgi:hypothetical protein
MRREFLTLLGGAAHLAADCVLGAARLAATCSQPAFRLSSGSTYPPSKYRGLPVHGRNLLTAKRAPGCSIQMDSSRWLTVIVPSWKA